MSLIIRQSFYKMAMHESVKLVTFYVLVVFLYMSNGSYDSFTPVDNYLIACGSLKNITFQGRTFVPDSDPSSLVILKTKKSVVVTSNSSAPFPVYQSSRILWGKTSYEFKIKQQGPHWIRLYFYPFHNLYQNLTSASITVITDSFVLLNNFNFMNSNLSYMFKEYAVNINSLTLSLTFIPLSNSVGFVNAIEVVSIPNKVFLRNFQKFALETMYRLNMGGSLSNGQNQNDNLGRNWEEDEKYILSNSTAVNVLVAVSTIKNRLGIINEIAPGWVYATAKVMGDATVSNLSWVFPINPNFMYFVRVHFCDIVSLARDSVVFNLFLNSNLGFEHLDLSSLTGGLSLPYYMDFVHYSSADNPNTLVVSVGPDMLSRFTNATINGLEIMKMSNNLGSLDGIDSVENLLPKSSPKSRKPAIIIGSVISASSLVLLIGLFYCYLVAHRSKTSPQSSMAAFKFGRLFTLQEIQDATSNFHQGQLLGHGGFGKVYKGTLDDGTKVAIKIGKPESKQGLVEFHNEIELLSRLRHRHLISLIGYCEEGSAMILVYEYMENGTLSSHLYGTEKLSPLSWKQRLEICLGATRGLHHLHTGGNPSIIHRNVKTTNILLDENFVAKVADLGISRIGPPLDKSHVTTAVKGSFGYIDPEYFRSRYLTEKSDVYSFGVVLCGRPALDDAHALPTEDMNLAGWALRCEEKGMFDQVIDPNLIGRANVASLNKVWEVARMCLAERRIERPSMGYVLCGLENALHLELASPVMDGCL